jgi:3'(2'), 5'-bisphosphate nucleotidase
MINTNGGAGRSDAAALRELLPAVERLARAAGALILQVYAGEFAVRGKADASPVTAADERAEALIVPALQALTPGWPVVAEEAAARGETPAAGDRFWLVDPLDGTREFVSRNGEFTVNIALVERGVPVLGVVFLPVPDRLYAGVVGQGAWLEEGGGRRAIVCRALPAAGATLASSRSHGDEAALAAWLQGRPVAARITAGSSLKFGLIAAGLADLYPRFGRTMEWDTAAGDAVLRAAGGQVCDLAGAPLRYGKPGFENPHFVASGASGVPPAAGKTP